MWECFRAVKATILLQIKKSFARPTFQFVIILQPILYSVFLYMVFYGQGRRELGVYLLGGVTILTLWNSMTMSSAGDIERERFEGNLENLFIAPTRFLVIMLGKVVGNTLLGLSSLLIITAFSHFVLQVNMAIQHPGIFLLSLLLLTVTFIILGLILMIVFSISRNARNYLNAFSFPVYILTGLFFPIEILPLWTRPLSYLLSPTWGFKCIRMAILGIENYLSLYQNIFCLILLLFIYLCICVGLLKIFYIKVRKRGVLGVY